MDLEKIHSLIDRQEFGKARKLLRSLLLKNKTNTDTLCLLAIVEGELGNAKTAVQILSKILMIEPKHPTAHYLMAGLLTRLGKHEDAMPHHDRAVSLLPENPWAYVNRGNSLAALKRFQDALSDFDTAIDVDPRLSSAFQNRGGALLELGLLKDSLSSLETALNLNPFNVNALSNKSECLRKLRLFEESLAAVNHALQLNPNHAEAWSRRGATLNDLKRHEEALASYNRSIELRPDYAEAYLNRGNTLNDLKRYQEALASYERSMELKSDIDFLLGALIHTQMKICDWTNLESRLDLLRNKIKAGDKCSFPLNVLGLFDSPELQLSISEIYTKEKCEPSNHLGPISKHCRRNKIRIGYFSMDFRDHPVAHLTEDLFQLHDRNRFEIYAFSFGANNQDPTRQRLEKCFNKFLDVDLLNDIDIARLSRELEVDIAIDLGGHTQDSRPRIFSERAAPIQINYLGYPGTWGHACMDYFIGDKITITNENRNYFSEKIIYMPDSFQVNSVSRPISGQPKERADFGLPDREIVFCCFNNCWKITPKEFESWMRILQRVPRSVLWLYAENPWASENLVARAGKYEISSERLIFAKRVPNIADHLARYTFANLFLDTFSYGAHTTASDALRMGLPVLTLPGKSFSSRVAASLLESLGLPDLVANTLEQYETLAIGLAADPEKLETLKVRLKQSRSATPLFNTAQFTEHLESAYKAIYVRYHADLTPDNIYISS
jgi:predicted O-linked N-acetylglucosamine transferase (SPINDLY family)